MIGLEKLDEDTVVEGLGTQFVQTLLKQLHLKASGFTRLLVSSGQSAEPHGRLCSLAGQAAAYNDVIRMIENAGKENDRP